MTHSATDLEFDNWIADAKACSLQQAVDLIGWQPKRGAHGADLPGPCPICGGNDRFAVNIVKNAWNCRKCGQGGNTGLGLYMFAKGYEKRDFLLACEEINGRPPPRGGQVSEERRAELQREAAARQEAQRIAKLNSDADRAKYSREEQDKAEKYWSLGKPISRHSEVGRYLAKRGLLVPEGAHLREVPKWKYYGGSSRTRDRDILAEVPAMFGRIRGAEGREMMGLHITYIDPATGKKLVIKGPDGQPLLDEKGDPFPAKKVRGTHKGGFIPLVWHPQPTRLYVGEGIETVLSVYMYLRHIGSPDLEGAAFWSSVNLGNLGGPAESGCRVFHPTETFTDKRGRTIRRKVPGPVPDMNARAMPVPSCVTHLILLGDNDSKDTFAVGQQLERAKARYAKEGRTIEIRWSAVGHDFNDMWLAFLNQQRREAAE